MILLKLVLMSVTIGFLQGLIDSQRPTDDDQDED